jgi:arsenate reductase
MKKRVLFLCTGNSARSQMAEGFLRHLAGEKFDVFSAGVNPTQVNPLAIKVMAEAGVDISKHKSKSAMEFIGQKFDYVITVCDNAKQTCPVFPGKYEKIHWSLEDPAEVQGSEEERIITFRRIRDKIEHNIKDWIKSIAL